ncbi:MAG: hypothetical protein QXI59_03925 [Candidatus Bathyarchaeia archaeon]|nr:DNA replication complex GINS family protein [Candidatus Bathyarchaeota archaeon]
MERDVSVDDARIKIESSFISIRVLRDVPELFFSGNALGPLKEGQEIEVPRWMASEFIRYRMAKILNDKPLDVAELTKIHWRESIPGSRELPPLDYDFYHKLRSLIKDLAVREEYDHPNKPTIYRILTQAKDIITCRIRKILNLAAAPLPSGVLLERIALEERILYNRISCVIDEWRKAILPMEGEG